MMQRILQILSAAHRRLFFVHVGYILVGAVLEVFSLAAILPLILLVIDPAVISENAILNSIYASLGLDSERAFIVVILLAIFALFVIKNLVAYRLIKTQAKYIYAIATAQAEKMMRSFFAQPFQTLSQTNSSITLRNTIHVPVEFSVYIILGTLNLLSEGLIAVLILGGIAIFDAKIFLWLILLLGPAMSAIYFLKKGRLREIGAAAEKLRPQSIQRVMESIRSYVDIRLYHKEEWFIERFLLARRELNDQLASYYAITLLPPRLIEVVAVFGMIIIVIYGLFNLDTREETILLLTLFAAAAYRVMPSFNRIFTALMNIRTFRYTIDILADKIHEISSQEGVGEETIPFERDIVVSDLVYQYPDTPEPVLRGVSFTMKKGETLGIIGESGVGKTTLIHLLLRLLPENGGSIVIDGQGLTPERDSAWQQKIGYVQQQPYLLDASIRDNVAFGVDHELQNEDKLQRAVQQAGLAKLIADLPAGLNSQIGEGGARLSGGQQQRIAIARALYRDAELLVFDEATSDLDADTEAEIAEAIGALAGSGVTVLVIAHRPSILAHCDRVIELKDGEMVD